MKKSISLILATVLIVMSFCSCGKMSKNKMLEKSAPLALGAVIKDFKSNSELARETYLNKPYTVVGRIAEISDEGKVSLILDNVKTEDFNDIICTVTLPKKETEALSAGKLIQVVGMLTEFDSTKETVNFEYGNLVTDDVTISGKLVIIRNIATHSCHACVRTTYKDIENDHSYPVYYVLERDIKSDFLITKKSININNVTLNENDHVTVTGKFIWEDAGYLASEITDVKVQ